MQEESCGDVPQTEVQADVRTENRVIALLDEDLRAALLARAQELVRGRGTLVFLTLFGSTLYGTRVEGHSDLDVRGLYLPQDAPESLESCQRQPGLHCSSGSRTQRNDCHDTDIDLAPLDKFVCRSLPRLDTGAVDLLFAPGNAPCVLFSHPALQVVFDHPLDWLNLQEEDSCRRYCHGQGNTFGLEGTRLGALYRVYKKARGLDGADTLAAHADDFVLAAKAPLHCHKDEEGHLILAEQCHMPSTTLAEFVRRLEKKLQGHLARLEEAEQSTNVDFKALSHAVRSIRQQEELLTTGRIVYPLACRDELVRIKCGQYSFAEVEALIVQGLQGLDILRTISVLARLHGRNDYKDHWKRELWQKTRRLREALAG